MTNVNSPSEQLWELLHLTGAALDGGFADELPPMPAPGAASVSGAASGAWADRYAEYLAWGETWPAGQGAAAPQAVILAAKPLSENALAFVRSWFENAKVALSLTDHFYLQPLPSLAGDKPPYAALAADLCSSLGPKAVLSLGALPAQKILGAPLSLDTLRSSDYRFGRWSMITTLDPEDYDPTDEEASKRFKAQVWKDLQRLLGKLRYG
jgi:hypothetical protein